MWGKLYKRLRRKPVRGTHIQLVVESEGIELPGTVSNCVRINSL